MKKFTVPCDFNGVQSPFTIYVGAPKQDHHPVHFQADWLSKERGGNIPDGVMDSLAKLKDLAQQNGVKFEDLCVYALGAAQQEAGTEDDEENTPSEDANENFTEEVLDEHQEDDIINDQNEETDNNQEDQENTEQPPADNQDPSSDNVSQDESKK